MTESDRAAAERRRASLVKDVRGPGEAFGRFVGRKDELRAIGEVLAAATKRTARVLTIRGDHGVGKTRLLYEVERRLRKGGYNVGFHIATCPPRGDEFPLSGIVCMLQVLCGVAEGDAHDRILAVQPRLRALGLQDDEVSAVLTALGANVPSLAGNAKALAAPGLHAHGRRASARTARTPSRGTSAHAMDEDSFALLEDVLRAPQAARASSSRSRRAPASRTRSRGSTAHVALDLGDLDADGRRAPRRARASASTRVPDELAALRARARRRAPAVRRGGHQGRSSTRGAVTVADGTRRRDEARRAGPRAAQDAARPRRVARRAPVARGPRDAPGRGRARRSDRRDGARADARPADGRRSSARSRRSRSATSSCTPGPSRAALHVAASSARSSSTR